jgi:hypothetical protein
MNDLIVIMGATEVHGTMPLYQRQLEEASIEVYVYQGLDRPNMNGGGNLAYRVEILRRLAQQFSHFEKIVFSDAFDVTFYGKKENLLKKIPTDALLHAAEKNCYPTECLPLPIPDRGPWRYANGGLVAGTPERFLEWCAKAEQHPRYRPSMLDQQFLNELVAEDSPLCRIDHRTNLFFCLHSGYQELDFTNGIPINTMHCTFPMFLHANGKWTADEMFARYERSLHDYSPGVSPQLS